MAGDWIKIEGTTPDKPEILRAARKLGISKYEVLGKLVCLWRWFDQNSVDGHVDGVASTDVDALIQQEGFAAVMADVGWIEYDDAAEVVTLPNFDAHNGETAKKRALKNKRQARWRKNSDGDVDGSVDNGVDTPASTTASTREEKNNTLLRNGDESPSPEEIIWSIGVKLLTKSGEPEQQARSFLGKLAKHDEGNLREAILYLKSHPKVDPKTYLAGAAGPRKRKVVL